MLVKHRWGRLTSRVYLAFVFCVVVFFAIPLQPVYADRGMVGPERIVLHESSQNAIIAWNGHEEVLILSTNVQSSSDALILEILPLPAQPTTVTESSLASFETLIELLGLQPYFERSGPEVMGGQSTTEVQIVFHEVLGAHDVTVVQVNALTAFINWVDAYADAQQVDLTLSHAFTDAVQDYLNRKIRYFVFDAINANQTTQTINPLVYRFKTDALYYPMLLTAASNLDTQRFSAVNLFLITEMSVEEKLPFEHKQPLFPGKKQPGTVYASTHTATINRTELQAISPDLDELFPDDPQATYVATSVLLSSVLADLNQDLLITFNPEQDLVILDPGSILLILAVFVVVACLPKRHGRRMGARCYDWMHY